MWRWYLQLARVSQSLPWKDEKTGLNNKVVCGATGQGVITWLIVWGSVGCKAHSCYLFHLLLTETLWDLKGAGIIIIVILFFYFAIGKTGIQRGKITKSWSQMVRPGLSPNFLDSWVSVIALPAHCWYFCFLFNLKFNICVFVWEKENKDLFMRVDLTFSAQAADTETV